MEKTETKNKVSRSFVGTVLSVSGKKSIVVEVERMKMNKKYHKQYKVSQKYHVHDEKNVAKVGDTVKLVDCRPMSATKRWRLSQVVKSNQ